MRLRTSGLIIALVVGILPPPPTSDAQQPPQVPRIGYLHPASATVTGGLIEKALGEIGYVAGQTIIFEDRWAGGKPERLPGLAADLARLKVDIIVAVSPPAIQAAKDATSTIPIVMAFSGDDPVERGFVASLARPGGNITGLTLLNPEMTGKRLQLIKEAVPRLGRIAVLEDVNRPDSSQVRHARVAARCLGIQLHLIAVRDASEYDNAFAAMRRERVGALFVPSHPVFFRDRREIVDRAAKSRLPAIYEWTEMAEAGGLMAYGPSLPRLSQRVAYYIDRILKGAKPADLPVEQPTHFELAINLKTAKALGLTFPQSVLVRADRVIR